MNELSGKPSEGQSMDKELLNALVNKVMDMGAQIKEMAEQIKKLAEGTEAMRGVNERLANQETRVEELIRKESEMTEVIRQATEKIDLPVEKVKRLQATLEDQISIFKAPLDKTVRHHHLIGKPFWILLGTILICSGMSAGMIWQWQRADNYAEDEMRWRAVKLITDPAMTEAVNQIVSSSQNDPTGFARGVAAEEYRREELTKNVIREQEARRRIDELQNQKAKK